MSSPLQQHQLLYEFGAVQMTFKDYLPYLWAVLTTAIGLGMWQYQLIAKRRYEVVEHALTIVGEAAQALHSVRRAEADALTWINIRQESFRPDVMLAIQSRIQQSAATFQELEAVAKSIGMHFGEDAAKSFVNLVALYTRICEAQSGLYFRGGAEKIYPTGEQTEQVAAWKKTLSVQEQGDAMTQEINDTERRIVIVFTKYLRPSIWRLFIPFWSWKN